MITSIALALILAAGSAAPAAQTSILVLSTGQRLEVRSVDTSRPGVLKMVLADGTASIMRGAVDTEKTEAANAELRQRRESAERAEAEAEEKRAAEIAEKAAANEATRAGSARKRGSLSTASGYAASVPAATDGKVPETSAPAAAPAGDTLASVRSQYQSAKVERARIVAEHDRVVAAHNADIGVRRYTTDGRPIASAEAEIGRAQLAQLRTRLAELDARLAALRSRHEQLREEARKAGRPASEWRLGVDGEVR